MNKNVKKPYCPVTFIGKEMNTDPDLNSMFLLPYKTKTLSDAFHAKVFEEECINIKENDPENGDRKVTRYGFDVFNNACTSNNDAVTAYLVMNVTELTMTVLTQFIQEAFITNGVSMTVAFLPSVDEVRDVVIRAIHSYPEAIDMNEAQCYIHFDTMMDSIFAHIVAEVFDKVITSNIYRIASCTIPESKTESLLDVFYEALFEICYSAPSDHLPDDVSTEIVFCTSIVRDIANDYLVKLRSGLTAMCVTLSNMSAYSMVNYAPLIAGGSTTAKDFVNDNVAFKSIVEESNNRIGKNND